MLSEAFMNTADTKSAGIQSALWSATSLENPVILKPNSPSGFLCVWNLKRNHLLSDKWGAPTEWRHGFLGPHPPLSSHRHHAGSSPLVEHTGPESSWGNTCSGFWSLVGQSGSKLHQALVFPRPCPVTQLFTPPSHFAQKLPFIPCQIVMLCFSAFHSVLTSVLFLFTCFYSCLSDLRLWCHGMMGFWILAYSTLFAS